MYIIPEFKKQIHHMPRKKREGKKEGTPPPRPNILLREVEIVSE